MSHYGIIYNYSHTDKVHNYVSNLSSRHFTDYLLYSVRIDEANRANITSKCDCGYISE